MIITKTPFRMSFFGGGTDMEDYFKEYGGAVLSTSFDKYCYVNVRHLPPFFQYSTELSYSKTERVNSLDEIQHPAIREAMRMLNMQEIRLMYEADLPARSGLGTSSSFAVGMLHAFHALKGKYVDKKTLADQAIYLERVLCNEAGGWQDQIAASFGGLNRIDFSAEGYRVSPILISPERKKKLNENLMLFFTGFIFPRVVRRNLTSLTQRSEVALRWYHCFTPSSWIIMSVMIALGVTIRTLELAPPTFITGFYTGLGLSLILSIYPYLREIILLRR